MAVRNLTFLKLLALLIFTFELLAPVVIISNDEDRAPDERALCTVTASHGNFNLFASLICEEAGNEEGREGKDHKTFFDFTEVNFVAIFQCLIQQENLPQPKAYHARINSGTSLLSFISIYRL